MLHLRNPSATVRATRAETAPGFRARSCNPAGPDSQQQVFGGPTHGRSGARQSRRAIRNLSTQRSIKNEHATRDHEERHRQLCT